MPNAKEGEASEEAREWEAHEPKDEEAHIEGREGGLDVVGQLNNELALLDIAKDGIFARGMRSVRILESGDSKHPEIHIDNLKTEIELFHPTTPEQETTKAKALDLVDQLRDRFLRKE
ncbi:MAG: hypothetical protein V1778_01230 [bacterium]